MTKKEKEISEKVLDLMCDEEANCYSCIHYKSSCTKFKTNRDATTECVEDNYSSWEANIKYFVSIAVYGSE